MCHGFDYTLTYLQTWRVLTEIKSKHGNILTKTESLRIYLNIHSSLTLSNHSSLLLVPLRRYSLTPLHPVCVRLVDPLLLVFVSHNTDTLVQNVVLPYSTLFLLPLLYSFSGSLPFPSLPFSFLTLLPLCHMNWVSTYFYSSYNTDPWNGKNTSTIKEDWVVLTTGPPSSLWDKHQWRIRKFWKTPTQNSKILSLLFPFLLNFPSFSFLLSSPLPTQGIPHWKGWVPDLREGRSPTVVNPPLTLSNPVTNAQQKWEKGCRIPG